MLQNISYSYFYHISMTLNCSDIFSFRVIMAVVVVVVVVVIIVIVVVVVIIAVVVDDIIMPTP